MKREVAKIYETDEYEKFRLAPLNRPIGKRPQMVELMEEHGFMTSSAIHVTTPDSKGVHTIVRGHHRFINAQDLGIPIKYIVDDSCTDLFLLEISKTQAWSGKDWFDARCREGNMEVLKVRTFINRHGIAWGCGAGLCMGHTTSGNATREISAGTYKATAMAFADDVVSLAEKLNKLGVNHTKSPVFLYALAQCLYLPGFEPQLLVNRVASNPGNLIKCSGIEENIKAIGEAYNHAAKGKRIDGFFDAVKKEAFKRKTKHSTTGGGGR